MQQRSRTARAELHLHRSLTLVRLRNDVRRLRKRQEHASRRMIDAAQMDLDIPLRLWARTWVDHELEITAIEAEITRRASAGEDR